MSNKPCELRDQSKQGSGASKKVSGQAIKRHIFQQRQFLSSGQSMRLHSVAFMHERFCCRRCRHWCCCQRFHHWFCCQRHRHWLAASFFFRCCRRHQCCRHRFHWCCCWRHHCHRRRYQRGRFWPRRCFLHCHCWGHCQHSRRRYCGLVIRDAEAVDLSATSAAFTASAKNAVVYYW